MNRAKKVYLISKVYNPDDIGQYIDTETKDPVFALLRSASASEASQAEDGFKREIVFDVRLNEYNGQDEVEYKDERYTIYRHYFNHDTGFCELYTERRIGT